MKTIKFLAVAILAVSLASCCACRKSKSSVPFIGTIWKLSQLYGVQVTGSKADSYTATFYPEGRAAGVGECNRFSGSFKRSEGSNSTSGKLSMANDFISTRMMCPNLAQEGKFLGMLREIDSYSIDGGRLMLIKGGDVLAIFDRMTEPVVSTQPIDEPKEIQW